MVVMLLGAFLLAIGLSAGSTVESAGLQQRPELSTGCHASVENDTSCSGSGDEDDDLGLVQVRDVQSQRHHRRKVPTCPCEDITGIYVSDGKFGGFDALSPTGAQVFASQKCCSGTFASEANPINGQTFTVDGSKLVTSIFTAEISGTFAAKISGPKFFRTLDFGNVTWSPKLVADLSSPLLSRSRSDFKKIICPFLSALVNQGVLPVQPTYHKDDLFEVTAEAGLPTPIGFEHVEENFFNNPTGFIDIFELEGVPNEHVNSTGINDCPTTFVECSALRTTNILSHEVRDCRTFTQTEDCGVPNAAIFEAFFAATDTNGDGVLTNIELTENTEGLPIVDANPIGLGTIPASHTLLMIIFGSSNGTFPSANITKSNLFTVEIERKFPADFDTTGFTLPVLTPF